MIPPEKVEVPLARFNRLINTGPVVLVSTMSNEGPNVMTCAWNMPCARKPPTIALAIGSASHTHSVLRDTRECVVNVPAQSQLAAVAICGKASGRDGDKFKLANLTPREAKMVKAPWVAETMGHLECRVVDGFDELIERYNLFLCEVLCVWAEEKAFSDGRWRVDEGRAPTLHHLGGPHFHVPGELLNSRD